MALYFFVVLAGCTSTGPTAATGTSETAPTQAGSTGTTFADARLTQGTGGQTDQDTGEAGDSASEVVFDASYVHEISVSFDQSAYEELVDTYEETGEKNWIEAIVTIDGETYESAGLRLKGNSSLRGLGGGGFGGPGPGGDSTDTSQPEDLPWLIKLDKYIENQNHHGVSDFVVRSNTSETALNEAVALELLELAGLASQDAIYATFSVNDSTPALRLVIEHPDDTWMAENFDSGGALYKAESRGGYQYRGSDPAEYDEVFDQEAGAGNADMSPLIEFLDFINNSDDDTFNEELADQLDIDEFATYLAMQELINNFDDIDGPGNNSYLYYDTATGMFTVVAWDHNLAFGGFGGGGFPGGGPGFPGGGPDDGFGAPDEVGPGGFGPGGGEDDEFGGQDKVGPGGFGPGGNVLVERFLANEEWNALYEQKLAELTEQLIDSGTAQQVLDGWVDLLTSEATDLVSESSVAQEADQIAPYLSD
jgi:spore coat protein CotH